MGTLSDLSVTLGEAGNLAVKITRGALARGGDILIGSRALTGVVGNLAENLSVNPGETGNLAGNLTRGATGRGDDVLEGGHALTLAAALDSAWCAERPQEARHAS